MMRQKGGGGAGGVGAVVGEGRGSKTTKGCHTGGVSNDDNYASTLLASEKVAASSD